MQQARAFADSCTTAMGVVSDERAERRGDGECDSDPKRELDGELDVAANAAAAMETDFGTPQADVSTPSHAAACIAATIAPGSFAPTSPLVSTAGELLPAASTTVTTTPFIAS